MFRYAEYIYAVHKEQSFSKAATTLFISQSSLSITIKKVEERIGTAVFNRRTNPITLTEFGKKYLEALEEYRQIQNRLDNYVYDLNQMRNGHISIGAANFNATYLLPVAVKAFHEKFPSVTIDIHESATADLYKKMERGAIDLLFSQANISPHIALELDQASTAYRLACLGVGATFVTTLMIKKMLNPTDVVFYLLDSPQTAQTSYAYSLKDGIFTRSMEEFIKIARQTIPETL
ncbi:MAG: LysR family transcriptional regulator [Eubacteriales bacterium]